MKIYVHKCKLRHVCIILLLIKLINNDAVVFMNIRNISGIVDTWVPPLTFLFVCHLAWT